MRVIAATDKGTVGWTIHSVVSNKFSHRQLFHKKPETSEDFLAQYEYAMIAAQEMVDAGASTVKLEYCDKGKPVVAFFKHRR